MKIRRSYKILKLILGVALLTLVFIYVKPSHALAATTDCGIHSGNPDDYEGLVVDLQYVPSGGGTPTQALGVQARITTTLAPDGDGEVYNNGSQQNSIVLNQIKLPSVGFCHPGFSNYQDQYMVIMGYGKYQSKSGVYLDCDHSVGLKQGNPPKLILSRYDVTGVGVPAGQPAGGTWTVVSVQEPNGLTSYAQVTYFDPPPQESITGAVNTKNISTGAIGDRVNVQVILTDDTTHAVDTAYTNAGGRYGFSVRQGDQFSIAMGGSPVPPGYSGPFTDYQGAGGYNGIASAYNCGTAVYQLQISDNPSYPNNSGRSGGSICTSIGSNDMYNFVYTTTNPPVNESITGAVNTKDYTTGTIGIRVNAQVILTDNTTHAVTTVYTNSGGRYGFSVRQGDEFSIAMGSSPVPPGYTGPFTDYKGASGYSGIASAYNCGTAVYQLQISDNPSYPDNSGRSGGSLCLSVGANDMYNFVYTTGTPPTPACSITSPVGMYDVSQPITLSYTFGPPSDSISFTSDIPGGGLPPNAPNGYSFTVSTLGSYTITGTTSGGATCSTHFIVSQIYKPFFNVHGGNVQAGVIYNSGSGCSSSSAISTNNLARGSTYYGASGQMAAIASGAISGFASGENPDYSSVDSALPTILPNIFNFANLSGEGNLGRGYPSCVTNYFTQADSGTTDLNTASTNIAALEPGGPSNSVTWLLNPSQPSLTITGGQVNPGKQITILEKGTAPIDITGNISYAPYGDPTQVPLLTIISYGGNIFIDRGVSSLEGVYVAQPDLSNRGGFIVTCAMPSGGTEAPDKTYNDCKTPLSVNGSLSANVIEMLRSQGDAYQTGNPWTTAAETYTYSPEVWLPEASIACNTTSTTTPCYQNVIGLPPIY